MATGITNAWSTTPADNATADTALGPREQWAPSVVNDTIRTMMAMIKKISLDFHGGSVTGGSSTAYILTTNEVLALADGVSVTCRMHAANGAAPTLNVDGTGAVAIQCALGAAITLGTLLAGANYSFVYYAASAAWIVRGAGGASKFVGEVFEFAGSTVPALSLLCYGQAVSRTTYAALFTAISTTYGAGDGSTTFNVPDDRGRVVAGKDDMGGVSADRLTAQSGGLNGDTLGATGGAETHTITEAQLPAHTHGAGSLAAASDGAHEHFIFKSGSLAALSASNYPATSSGGTGDENYIIMGQGSEPDAGKSSTHSGHTHDVTGATGSIGSSTAHNNVQPTIVRNKCIFAGA